MYGVYRRAHTHTVENPAVAMGHTVENPAVVKG